MKATTIAWRAANREHYLEKRRKWREANKERLNAEKRAEYEQELGRAPREYIKREREEPGLQALRASGLRLEDFLP